MGFVKAFAGALSGGLAGQWTDFLTVPKGLAATVGACPAVKTRNRAHRFSKRDDGPAVITNGSLVVVPEGFALLTIENGAVTSFVSDPGGYRWESGDVNSRSFFAEDGLVDTVVWQTWDRFRYGGIPGAEQHALFVNLKEIPGNKFGTQGPVYWDDAYLNAQVGAVAHGTYSVRIVDPILFVQNFLPVEHYVSRAKPFDFADADDAAGNQLFSEVVASLGAAFSRYSNDGDRGHRITSIQGDAAGFARSLSAVVEANYAWRAERGLQMTKASIMAVDYQPETRKLLEKVQQADALSGARGNSNLQAAFADGLREAGANPAGGALGMGFMGVGMQGAAASVGAMQQPVTQGRPAANSRAGQQGQAAVQAAEREEDGLYETLVDLKKLLDEGIITQEEFEKAKAKALGL